MLWFNVVLGTILILLLVGGWAIYRKIDKFFIKPFEAAEKEEKKFQEKVINRAKVEIQNFKASESRINPEISSGKMDDSVDKLRNLRRSK